MDFKEILPEKAVSLFVKSILVYEAAENHTHKTILPFFADGYPGIMYQETKNGLLVSPYEKKMPAFFLYGQTLKPIELIMEGSYRLIIIQLYPFVLQKFFGLEPKSINDSCYDLLQLEMPEIHGAVNQIQTECNTLKRIQILTQFLHSVFEEKKQHLDYKIRQSIQLILDHNGQLTVGELCNETGLNERTLERRFLNEVGVSPKQFSRIIQFQQSLEQLTEKEYDKLTDIVYSNGFTDQSHFIKVFKSFTGKTPKLFLKG
jgi:AraC-like DNA-binding protein